LNKGGMTPWVQSKNGWYLILVEEKKDSRLRTFDESRGAITEKIGTQKQNAEVDKFLAEIKSKNYIKILKPDPFADLN